MALLMSMVRDQIDSLNQPKMDKDLFNNKANLSKQLYVMNPPAFYVFLRFDRCLYKHMYIDIHMLHTCAQNTKK
jgi:hypothetical protein